MRTGESAMSSLRTKAKGRPCQIRIPGICNGDPETTVGCHYRLGGISGIGLKSPDLLIAWGCSACHQAIDTGHSANWSAQELRQRRPHQCALTAYASTPKTSICSVASKKLTRLLHCFIWNTRLIPNYHD
jgi:Protein of unknown function (DUF1364)